LNIVLLSRDLLEGTADLALAGLVVLATFLYALVAVSIAARIFGADAVLYSERGGWSVRFWRRARPG
jgi:hypothetical protein